MGCKSWLHRDGPDRRLRVAGSMIVGIMVFATFGQGVAVATPRSEPVVITDIAYAPPDPPGNLGHLLDLYLPAQRGKSKRPLVIFSRTSLTVIAKLAVLPASCSGRWSSGKVTSAVRWSPRSPTPMPSTSTSST